ncbi:MAG TPA: hypothetical protein DG942_03315 [Ruminococcaceae bacterium]|jgi:hypothetical protein|nr:hypothetical protein [Oscillospiraceae bacterium]
MTEGAGNMRLRSKKGISLVELIAVMAISVIVVGAAMAALFGGARDAAEGAEDCGNHGDAYLLETWLRKDLPTAEGISINTSKIKGPNIINMYFASDDSVAVEQGGRQIMRINGVQSIGVQTKATGANEEFCYTITAKINRRTFTLKGGVVMNNVPAMAADINTTLTYTPAAPTYVNITKS